MVVDAKESTPTNYEDAMKMFSKKSDAEEEAKDKKRKRMMHGLADKKVKNQNPTVADG